MQALIKRRIHIRNETNIYGNMSYDNFFITKRDGTKESFSLEKIKSAILKAFESVNEPIHAADIDAVMANLRF